MMAQQGYVHQEYPKHLHHPEGKEPLEIVYDEDEENEVLARWAVAKETIELALDSLRDKLLARAQAAGIKVDQRWSDKRLLQIVEDAERAPQNP